MLTRLPLSHIFRKALSNGGDFADIFFEQTTQHLILAENGEIEKIITGTDSGIGIRVIHDGKSAYGYSNDFSEKALLELAGTISKAAAGNIYDKDIALSVKHPPVRHSVTIRPETVEISGKVALVREADAAARAADKRVRQCTITYRDSVRKIAIANSLGELAEDEKIDLVFLPVIVAADEGVIQTGYEPVGGFAGCELFDGGVHVHAAKSAAKRAVKMLTARPAPTGKMPVVLSSEAGGTMVHEAVGHGLEADLAIGGFSVYGGRIGEQVASPLVTVVDDATLRSRRGSYSFDDEAVPGARTVLIENGVLRSYMHDRITAAKTGVPSTGNGRRESYRFRPVVRMSNTMISPGGSDPCGIVKSTGHGLFVKKMGGGQVNTINGDFVFEVQEGYIIRDGAISEPVRGATLTGNGPEVLKTIDMVGSDIGFAIGTCGKDSQGVPVGDAQPTLRIPEMVVGGIV
jgi:TldD protein